jgi:hypothetical protein
VINSRKYFFVMLMVVGFLLPVTKTFGANKVIAPMLPLLLSDEGQYCLYGLPVTGSSSLGGPYSYYDVTVRIDGGPATYLTAFRGQRYDGENYGYRFSFFPEAKRRYEFSIQAKDPMGLAGEPSDFSSSFSLPGNQGKTNTGPFPIADAGENQVVLTNTQVQLDGSGSYDGMTGSANGLVYNWEVHFSKEPISLENSNTATPTFTPAIAGSYTFRLQVSKANNNGSVTHYSLVRYITVHVVDDLATALVVNMGQPIRVPLGETMKLNGSGSLPEPDDGGIYRWDFINHAAIGSNAQIQSSNNVVATFTPDVIGTYLFRLSVYKGEDFEYKNMLVSVYDKKSVGKLIEQPMSVDCGFSCINADLDGDGEVSQADLDLFLSAKGSVPGEQNYLREADLNRDRLVNSLDEKVFTDCLK